MSLTIIALPNSLPPMCLRGPQCPRRRGSVMDDAWTMVKMSVNSNIASPVPSCLSSNVSLCCLFLFCFSTFMWLFMCSADIMYMYNLYISSNLLCIYIGWDSRMGPPLDQC